MSTNRAMPPHFGANNPPAPVRLATTAQAAEHFQVSTRTIRAWVAKGVLSAVRIGGRALRIDLESVKAHPVGGSTWAV